MTHACPRSSPLTLTSSTDGPRLATPVWSWTRASCSATTSAAEHTDDVRSKTPATAQALARRHVDGDALAGVILRLDLKRLGGTGYGRQIKREPRFGKDDDRPRLVNNFSIDQEFNVLDSIVAVPRVLRDQPSLGRIANVSPLHGSRSVEPRLQVHGEVHRQRQSQRRRVDRRILRRDL